MLEPGRAQKRVDIPYFEGVNSLVSFNMGKKTEFFHAENARSKTIGTIEKREGQTILGVNINGQPFVTSNNYGLFSFQDGAGQGFYRISVNESSDININVYEDIFIADENGTEVEGDTISQLLPFSIAILEEINISEQVNNYDSSTASTIYYLDNSNKWTPLSDAGTNIPGGLFDYTYAEGCTFLVNQVGENRYINEDGVTVTTSSDGGGHLFNSPKASKINFYKNRLYLADFVYNGIRYPTTILRSSYPLGIIGLLNADYSAAVPGSTLDVTDTKYLYTNVGANVYDIYRGNILVTVITVTQINESSIVATWSGAPNLLSSDEIWVSGTHDDHKFFRWVNNPSVSGRDVQQYNSFKLSGGENDPINVLTNIGNVMFAANKNAMISWNDYTLENFDLDIGCVSKKGYVKMIGTMYFLHYTGIYATSGSVPKLISNKIEKYITGATKLGKENSAAGKKGRSIFFTLGDVTLYHLDGSLDKVLKDVCVEFNIIQENWYIHTNVKASEFATFVEATDSGRLEFTDTSGHHDVKEFLCGETDDGEVIHFRVDTMKLTTQPGNFEYSSKAIALLTEAERGAAMKLFVNLENEEEYYQVDGTISKGLSVIKITGKDDSRGKPPYCRLISLSIRDSSPQLCKISRMTLVTLPTTDENSTSDE